MKARLDFPQDDGTRLAAAFRQPLRVLVTHRVEEVKPVIAQVEAEARAGRWAIGFVAYESAPAFDLALRVRAANGTGIPLAAFAIYGEAEAVRADVAAPDAGRRFECSPWRMIDERPQIQHAVELLRERIAAGGCYQVNLTTRLRAEFAGDSLALFEALRATQPAGYCLHLDAGDWQVLSVSPELFFDWTPAGALTTRPMKGTAPRDADPVVDEAAAAGLRVSAKERAENMMIVDLMRNDLGRVAIAGSVRVPALFDIEPLPTAWQMTSTVQCTTRPEVGLADVFDALFPCGSVTGAPKIAAMQSIAELESAPRGAYCGAIGVVRPGGHATFNVGIRTVAVTGARAECGVGSGITHLSTPAGEYDEWLVKLRFLLRASASFTGETQMLAPDRRQESLISFKQVT